jgi:transaldolase
MMNPLKIKVFADGARIEDMAAAYRAGQVQGFTTNPTLMKKAGVTDYECFAREALAVITDLPISFEVFADELDEMLRQARHIATWGTNVYVKIPVTNTRGESTAPIQKVLSAEGIKLNVEGAERGRHQAERHGAAHRRPGS